MSPAERVVAIGGGWDGDRSTSLMMIIPQTKIGVVCSEKNKSHRFKPLDTHYSLCHLDEELQEEQPALESLYPLSGARCQQQQAGRRRKKHASFASSSLVTQETPHEVYEDEVHALWYSEADLEAIAESNRQTCALVKSRGLGFESNQEYCKRGLESQLAESLFFLKSPQETIDKVLDRQIDLWCEDEGKNEQARLLAETYCIYASQYALKAIVRGVSDWYSIQEGDSSMTSDSQPLLNEINRVASQAQ